MTAAKRKEGAGLVVDAAAAGAARPRRSRARPRGLLRSGCRGRPAAAVGAARASRAGPRLPRRRLRPFRFPARLRPPEARSARPIVRRHDCRAACSDQRRNRRCTFCRRRFRNDADGGAAHAEARGAFADRARRSRRRERSRDDGAPAERSCRCLRRGGSRLPAARRACARQARRCPIPMCRPKAPDGSCSAWASSARRS